MLGSETKVMALKNSVSNGKCEHILAYYNDGNDRILPYYNKGNNSWIFDFLNQGSKCDAKPTQNYTFIAQFICSDDEWPQSQTNQISDCVYQMDIASMYTC